MCGGVVLAFVAIGFLIFFIHHVASSLQASNVIAAAAAETLGAIDRLFPETLKAEEISPEGEAHLIALEKRPQTIIPAPASGYIQSNNEGALVRLARCRSMWRDSNQPGLFASRFQALIICLFGPASLLITQIPRRIGDIRAWELQALIHTVIVSRCPQENRTLWSETLQPADSENVRR